MVRTLRFGLALRDDRLVGVELARGELTRIVEKSIGEGESLSEALAGVLRELRGPRRAGSSLGVSISDRRCRSGALYAVDPQLDATSVAAQLRASPESFFTGAPGSLITGSVWVDDGVWHGVVLDRDLAATLVDVCADAHCRLRGILGDARQADLDALALAAAKLRPDAERTVDLSLTTRVETTRRRHRAGLVLASVVLLAWAAAAPAMGHRRELAHLRIEERWVEATIETHRTTLQARELSPDLVLSVQQLHRDRARLADLLQTLAAILPDSSAIVSLAIRDRSGTLILLSTDVGDAIARTASVPELASLRVAGVIAHESQAGAELQRATLVWGEHNARRTASLRSGAP